LEYHNPKPAPSPWTLWDILLAVLLFPTAVVWLLCCALKGAVLLFLESLIPSTRKKIIMQTITESGTVPPPKPEHVWKGKCSNCKTKFTASGKDVYTTSYTRQSSTSCPKCGAFVNLSGIFVGNEILWLAGITVVLMFVIFIANLFRK
jgi:DNA-directed RNA polymerase subunit RPC12/RpoP